VKSSTDKREIQNTVKYVDITGQTLIDAVFDVHYIHNSLQLLWMSTTQEYK